MITPVEPAPNPGTKVDVRQFTHTAVQRAMDAKAAAWGAPAGYYTVTDRAAVISPVEQVWRVKVRLFGGGIQHFEDIVFNKPGGDRKASPAYMTTYERYVEAGGKKVELFKLTQRYPTTSLEAAVHWEGKA